ncbi:MAG: type I secretion system permease/ATPase [Alphaproteobacteria bacterium]|nr:type I secretion system permease/ATPase [Alphaproteobacteria bacterium]MBU2143365.1 type I secretion system permease/ATPase [Alphaproteobacteria bacterium]MBU2196806.1 type I secretion system permease/ATPase [Alphaproteobacteria bacterium]
MAQPESGASRELAQALSASRRIFLHLAAFSLFVNLLMLTGPLYMLQVYDRVLASQSMPTLVSLTLLILLLYGTLGILEWVRSGLFGAAASRFENALGERAANAAMASSLRDAGRQTERPIRDLRTLRRFLSSPALNAAFDAPWTPLFFIVLFLLHPAFFVWALFGCLVLVGLGLLNQKNSSRLTREAEDTERRAQLRASEMVRNAEVLDAMGMRGAVRDRWRGDFDASDAAIARSNRVLSAFSSGTKAFRLFLQSAILGLGAWLAIKGDASHGAMIAASILMGRAIAPIEQTVGQWRSIVNAREAWSSLNGFLAQSAIGADTMELPPIRGFISVEAVFAGPAGAKKPLLRGLNFTLEPGDVLGVLGPSAAGKSTFARVMTGVWPAQAGHVRIDGADISSYERNALGWQIGYLPQQTDLMAGTVRDNIARFDRQAEPGTIIAAAEAAACHDLILRLPDGYDTEIGTGGAYLSAGQRQRVGLARALFGEPNFVVLDEPNSNLDGPGDEALQKAILGLKARGATTILIAHRPNAILHCNKLMVLDGGEIRAFGPRDEVLGKITPNHSAPNVRTMCPSDANV